MIKLNLKKILQLASINIIATPLWVFGSGQSLTSTKRDPDKGWYYTDKSGNTHWHQTLSEARVIERKKRRQEAEMASMHPNEPSNSPEFNELCHKGRETKETDSAQPKLVGYKLGVGVVVLIDNEKDPTDPYCVFIRRGKPPYGIACVGGRIEGMETSREAAIEELHEELSIDYDPSCVHMEKFHSNDDPDQHPDYRVSQSFYRCNLPSEFKYKIRPGDDAQEVYIIALKTLCALMKTDTDPQPNLNWTIETIGRDGSRKTFDIRPAQYYPPQANATSGFAATYPTALGWALKHEHTIIKFFDINRASVQSIALSATGQQLLLNLVGQSSDLINRKGLTHLAEQMNIGNINNQDEEVNTCLRLVEFAFNSLIKDNGSNQEPINSTTVDSRKTTQTALEEPYSPKASESFGTSIAIPPREANQTIATESYSPTKPAKTALWEADFKDVGFVFCDSESMKLSNEILEMKQTIKDLQAQLKKQRMMEETIEHLKAKLEKESESRYRLHRELMLLSNGIDPTQMYGEGQENANPGRVGQRQSRSLMNLNSKSGQIHSHENQSQSLVNLREAQKWNLREPEMQTQSPQSRSLMELRPNPSRQPLGKTSQSMVNLGPNKRQAVLKQLNDDRALLEAAMRRASQNRQAFNR